MSHEDERIAYLIAGGWVQNAWAWWHPPHCLASFPLEQAHKMAREDERRGLRMTTPAEGEKP